MFLRYYLESSLSLKLKFCWCAVNFVKLLGLFPCPKSSSLFRVQRLNSVTSIALNEQKPFRLKEHNLQKAQLSFETSLTIQNIAQFHFVTGVSEIKKFV